MILLFRATVRNSDRHDDLKVYIRGLMEAEASKYYVINMAILAVLYQ